VEQVFHIFGYLKKIPKKRIVFDPDYPAIEVSGSSDTIGPAFIGIARN
jgi:hypothetical protein